MNGKLLHPFENEEKSWPPPMCIIDSITGEYSIYYKGETTRATQDRCSSLEEAAVWEAEHIIDRIISQF